MKVNGIELTSPRIVEVYLPISGGEAVQFKFRPLSADEDFEKVLSRPQPPQIIKPGGVTHHNTEDKAYKAALADWVEKKLNWEFLKSVSITDGLEFSTVDMEKPETWGNWNKEAEKVFGQSELKALYQGFLDAQYISEEVMEKARARFLIGVREQNETYPSRMAEAVNTPSSVPANA